jgi:hypothetical protein
MVQMMDDRRDFAYAVWDDETDGRDNPAMCYDQLGTGGAVVRSVITDNKCYAAALFDLKAKVKVEAVYGLSLTLGMVVTIGLSLTMMAVDMQRMLVQPVNEVLDIFKGILMVRSPYIVSRAYRSGGAGGGGGGAHPLRRAFCRDGGEGGLARNPNVIS